MILWETDCVMDSFATIFFEYDSFEGFLWTSTSKLWTAAKGNYFQEWKINGFVNLEEIWSHWMEFRKSPGMCIKFLTQNMLIWSVLCAAVRDSCNTREVPDLFFVQPWETPATLEKSLICSLCSRERHTCKDSCNNREVIFVPIMCAFTSDLKVQIWIRYGSSFNPKITFN